MKENYLAKIIIVGDCSVGKTFFIERLVHGKSPNSAASTVGVALSKLEYTLSNGEVILLHIWDTAGHERFRSMTSSYYRGALGVFLLFDITSQASFDSLEDWLATIRAHVHSDAVVLLAGNKSDLESTRVVPRDKAEAFSAAQH